MTKESLKRSEWFRHDRFGMFIHFGLYSIPARGEWLMSNARMTPEEYHKYFDMFNPKNLDMGEWARICKKAGMKYAVLTAKHHDGFCLFDSRYTDFKSTNTKYGRDIVRDFLEAFRKEGIRVGLYFSLIDWRHEDFPKYADRHHPMRGNEAYKDEVVDFDRYLEFMHAQAQELVTNYGKLDIMWFDFSYDDMEGEKWKASKLIEMVRKNQPDIIIDNRLEGSGENHGSMLTDSPKPYCGDFVCPEQILPPGGVVDKNGEPVPWELCATMNDHWGYANYDKNFKSPELIIKTLVECVSKGGNFLLNVGPNGLGQIPKESVEILETVGEWLSGNGDSIYGCGPAGIEKPEWGRYTRRGNSIFAHVYEDSLGALPLYGIVPDKIQNITYLKDGSEVKRGEDWNTLEFKDVAFCTFGDNPVFSYKRPDPVDTVLEISTS